MSELTPVIDVQIASPNTDPVLPLKGIAGLYNTNTNTSLNAGIAIAVPAPITLSEKLYDSANKSFPGQFLGVIVDGHVMEKNTGLDFVYMRQAAALAKITLSINDAFRSYAAQVAERVKRHYDQHGIRHPSEGEKGDLGPAAEPGTSNHGRGIALDIATGMSVDDLSNKRYTPTFIWLQANCQNFGFVWQASINEPWHYEHQFVGVKGTPSAAAVGGIDVTPAQVAAMAAQNRSMEQYNTKEMYDRSASINRSKRAALSDRDVMYGHAAANAIGGSAQMGSAQSGFVVMQELAAAQAKALSPADASATSYDFALGVWGDGKPT